jgi:hypothetical protein
MSLAFSKSISLRGAAGFILLLFLSAVPLRVPVTNGGRVENRNTAINTTVDRTVRAERPIMVFFLSITNLRIRAIEVYMLCSS